MTSIDKLAEVAESYFRELEGDGYRPEGCNGDDFACYLVNALGLTEEWGVQYRGNPRTFAGWHESRESAQRHIDMMLRNWDHNPPIQRLEPERPEFVPVSRLVGPWGEDRRDNTDG